MSSLKSIRPAHSAAFALGLLCALAAFADSTSLSVGDASTTVTGSSAVSMDFSVTRSGDLSYDAYLSYQTADDTAVAGSDYTASSGTVLIPAGASSTTVSVPVLGSSTPKADRAFKLDVLGAVGVGPVPTFVTGGSTGVGAVPKAVAVGDFNGDGKPDLAVANSQSSSISILRNSTAPGASSSTFTPAATFGAGSNPVAIVAADFNGDGRPDLAVASNFTNVAVWLNRTAPGAGSASFSAPVSYGVGSTPMSIAVGDFNGDGKPDLAVANYSSSTVSVLFNNTAPGASSASFATAATVPTGSIPSSVTAGDYNGDGRIDLATANAASDDVTILFNNTLPGDAAASFALAGTAPASSTPETIVTGDFNGDGKPDLAVANLYGHSVSILFNNTQPAAANAVFTVAATVGISSNGGPLVAADFNGDGKLDLAVGVQYSGHVSILRNETVPGASRARFTVVTNASSSSLPWALAVGDFNGDGKPDLAVTNYYENSASILLNTTPAPVAEVGYRTDTLEGVANGPYDIAVSDFNGDGKRDMAVVNRGGSNVSILLNGTVPGAASSQFTLAGSPAVGSVPWGAVAADFNTDGKPDLAVSNVSSDSISILFNTTAPGATSTSFTLAASPAAGDDAPSGLATGDFNGDGKPDLAATTESDTVVVLLNTTAPGAASASFAPAASLGVGSLPLSVAVGDFNSDGKPDLAAASYNDNSVSVLLNTTAPGATAVSFAPAISMVVGDAAWDVAVGDFNGDGRPDLAVAIFDGDSVAVLLNTTAPGATSASFTLAANTGVGNAPYSVAVGDFNGDGRLDLVTANLYSAASVLFNTAAPGAAGASFALAASPAVGAESVAVTVDDFNGDGRPDLAVANAGSDSVSVLLNTQYLASAGGSATGNIHYSIPAASLSPSSLDFGSQRVGSTSAAQTLTLSNSGSAPLTVDSIAAAGDFGQSNDCPPSLAPGAQCSIGVTFSPSASGVSSGTLTVATNDLSGSSIVSLAGTGIEPLAELGADALNFGQQLVGTASAAQTLILSNPGSATLTIAGIMASGDFGQSNDCGPMLSPGGHCTISVTFAPTASGAHSGAITVLSDAASSPDTVDLAGTGIAPVVQLAPASLNFGDVYVATSSATQSLTLSNIGDAQLQIAGVDVSGDFSQSGNCGSTLAPGASCTIDVGFAPQAAGPSSGTLTVLSDAASSPDIVELDGSGLKRDTRLTVNPGIGTLLPPQLFLGASAQLEQTTPTVEPLAGKTVTFTTRSGGFLCSGVTDASGHANCRGSLSILGILLGAGYRGSFAGDAQYNGAEDASPALEALP